MQIEISEDGYWTDADGNRWRLVPVKATEAQTAAAWGKASTWRQDGAARAIAWDYMQGYNKLVEIAPAPPKPHVVVPPAVALAEALGLHRNAAVHPSNPTIARLTGAEPVGGASELKR